MKEDAEEIKKYRQEVAVKIIKEYQNLIDKVFEITQKDLLDSEIKKAKDEESEKKYLDKIAHREKALDQIPVILDKIENIESKHLRETENETSADSTKTTNNSDVHPSKRHARN